MPKRALVRKHLSEWCESPLAEILRFALEQELNKTYQERADLFIPGDANRTQEVRSNLIGQEGILKDMILLLSNDTGALESYLEGNDVLIVQSQEEEDSDKYGD